jgi:hypothetical protein
MIFSVEELRRVKEQCQPFIKAYESCVKKSLSDGVNPESRCISELRELSNCTDLFYAKNISSESAP